MTTHLKVKWPDHHIVIELCQTPVVEKWKLCIQDVIENNVPPMITLGTPFYHAYGGEDQQLKKQAVQEINKAIEDVNALVGDGKKFPYHAYDDMPWTQTNLMHRCFTTGQLSQTCWQLQLTNQQKLQSKTIPDSNMLEWVHSIAPHDFEIWHCWEEFSSANNRINKWIHIYEDQSTSARATQFLNKTIETYGKDFKVVNLELDVFQSDGLKWYNNQQQVDIDTIHSSFPDDADDCNVILMKSITGKDYFQCFQEYDDPTEWDIQNVGKIKGGLTFYPHNDALKHILYSGDFESWYKSYGLKAEQVHPVPLGKIVEDTIDYATLKHSETDLNTDGTSAIASQYKQMRYELV